MSQQPDMFTPAIGKALADDGAQRALDHADIQFGSWSDRAYEFLQRYIEQKVPFRVEQVRKAAQDAGLPHAPDARAWGGVLMKAKKAGLLKHMGWVPCDDPNGHSHPVSLWRGK